MRTFLGTISALLVVIALGCAEDDDAGSGGTGGPATGVDSGTNSGGVGGMGGSGGTSGGGGVGGSSGSGGEVIAGSGGVAGVTTGGASGAGSGGESSPIVGAWFGFGPEFPDGDLCFIFCENGHLFTGDRPCTDTTAGDFTQYLRYTFSNGTFEGRSPEGVQLTGQVEIDGDDATFTFTVEGSGSYVLSMTRTASDSPLCASEDPVWSGW